MKTLRCLVTTFIPLFFSAPYALSWQDQYQVKGIYPFRVPPLQGRFSVSSAWPLWSSAVPASPAHSPKESENVHTNCRPKRKTTESTAKCIGGMDILHEDDAVIALNKPAGIRVVPSPANSGTQFRFSCLYSSQHYFSLFICNIAVSIVPNMFSAPVFVLLLCGLCW